MNKYNKYNNLLHILWWLTCISSCFYIQFTISLDKMTNTNTCSYFEFSCKNYNKNIVLHNLQRMSVHCTCISRQDYTFYSINKTRNSPWQNCVLREIIWKQGQKKKKEQVYPSGRNIYLFARTKRKICQSQCFIYHFTIITHLEGRRKFLYLT